MKNMSDLGLKDSPRATQAVRGKIGFNFPLCTLHMRLRSTPLVAQHNDFDFNPFRLDSIEKIRFGDFPPTSGNRRSRKTILHDR